MKLNFFYKTRKPLLRGSVGGRRFANDGRRKEPDFGDSVLSLNG